MQNRRSSLKSKLKRLGKYHHIMTVLAKYGFEEVIAAISGRFPVSHRKKNREPSIEKKSDYTRPVRARLALQELGPTFIKLGQLLSTRPDLVPPDYIREFESLQDKVPKENSDVIKAEVEKQLNKNLDEIFQSFDLEPIATGSIAQVHRAVTFDGNAVAVKVRRQGIVDTINTECEVLQDLAALLKASLFKNSLLDPQKMARELSQAVSVEVNLGNERHNQMRFLQNFSDDPTIHVPRIYKEYCTDGILTMEYIDGVKPISKAKLQQQGLDPSVVADRGAKFVLRQIFEFGFFHSDPHPGNFLFLPDNILVPLDFGQTAYLSEHDRKLFNEIVLAIVDKDAAGMLEALDRAEMVTDKTNVNHFLRDAEQMLDYYHDRPLKDIPLGKAISETFDLIRKHYIHPPPQFTLMLKSLATIESFANSLDPDFQLIEQLKPYARKFSMRDLDPKQILKDAKKTFRDASGLASKFPNEINSILQKFRQGKFQMRIHHEHLENLTNTIDKSSNRISFALIVAALLIASSLLIAQEGMVLSLISLQALGIIGYLSAAVIGLGLVVSIIKSRHL